MASVQGVVGCPPGLLVGEMSGLEPRELPAAAGAEAVEGPLPQPLPAGSGASADT